MSHGGYHGTIISGGQVIQQGSDSPGQSIGPAGMGGGSFQSDSRPQDFGSQTNQQQQQSQQQDDDKLNQVLQNIGVQDPPKKERNVVETMATDLFEGGKKGIETLLMPGGFSSAVIKEFFGSFKAADKFYNNLLTKGLDGMDDRELVTYGTLLAQGLDVSTLEDYANKNNLDPEQRYQLGTETDRLRGDILSTDYEGIVGAYKASQPKTLKDSVSALIGQYERPEGTITRDAAINKIGKAGMAYLDLTNPQLYDELQPYATMQGVEKLASRQFVNTGDRVADRRYNARIMEARALAADKQSRQDANMARTSPAFQPPSQPGTPPTTPPGTQPPTPTPPGATPVPAPPSGTTPTPSDYSQFPQFNMSDYARQGLGATPQFGDFQETLDRFFRFS